MILTSNALNLENSKLLYKQDNYESEDFLQPPRPVHATEKFSF